MTRPTANPIAKKLDGMKRSYLERVTVRPEDLLPDVMEQIDRVAPNVGKKATTEAIRQAVRDIEWVASIQGEPDTRMQQSREDAWGQSRRLVIKLGSQGIHEQNGLSAEQLQEQPRSAFRRYCREGEGAENGRARIRHNGRQSQVFGIIAAEEGADVDVAGVRLSS